MTDDSICLCCDCCPILSEKKRRQGHDCNALAAGAGAAGSVLDEKSKTRLYEKKNDQQDVLSNQPSALRKC